MVLLGTGIVEKICPAGIVDSPDTETSVASVFQSLPSLYCNKTVKAFVPVNDRFLSIVPTKSNLPSVLLRI